MNGFRKIFPTFLSHYATFFAKMAEKKVVPLDEFYGVIINDCLIVVGVGVFGACAASFII
jgi:hypothetical protein